MDQLVDQIDQLDAEEKDFIVQALSLMVDYESKIGKQRYFHVAFARLMELTNKIQ